MSFQSNSCSKRWLEYLWPNLLVIHLLQLPEVAAERAVMQVTTHRCYEGDRRGLLLLLIRFESDGFKYLMILIFCLFTKNNGLLFFFHLSLNQNWGRDKNPPPDLLDDLSPIDGFSSCTSWFTRGWVSFMLLFMTIICYFITCFKFYYLEIYCTIFFVKEVLAGLLGTLKNKQTNIFIGTQQSHYSDGEMRWGKGNEKRCATGGWA